MRKLSILLLAFQLLLFFSTSCIQNHSSEVEKVAQIKTSQLQQGLKASFSIAIGEDAEVFVSTSDTGIHQYSPAGVLLNVFSEHPNIVGLQYYQGKLYGYDFFEKNIIEIDVKTKEHRIIVSHLPVDEVRSMALLDENIYLLTVPSFEEVTYEQTTDSFIDFHEQFLKIQINDGTLTEIQSVKHPISLYANSLGELFIYAYPEPGNYVLYQYDDKTDSLTRISDMNDVGYLFHFAYEKEIFIYFSLMRNTKAKRMTDGLIYNVSENLPIAYGSCFTYYGEDIFFLEERYSEVDTEENHDGEHTHEIAEAHLCVFRTTYTLPYLREEDQVAEKSHVTISTDIYNKLLDTTYIEEKSNIETVYVEQPNDIHGYQEFIQSVLSGDNTTDIFIFDYSHPDLRNILSTPGYVPLNDISSIEQYLDSCFSWVSETARTSTGDIWMLPLYFDAPLLWYVPENLSHFSVSIDSMRTFDEYLNTIKNLSQNKGEYTTHATYLTYAEMHWNSQYNMTHYDPVNGIVDYDTQLYRDYFRSMWHGWQRYADPHDGDAWKHPVLQMDLSIDETVSSAYDTSRVICKIETMEDQFATLYPHLEDWRVLPLPRVSKEMEDNYFYCTYAMINPNSKNKEKAAEYLQTVAENTIRAINRPTFVQKDLSSYGEYLDISLPVFQDIHQIYTAGQAISAYPISSDMNQWIDDYQANKLSIEEVIESLQQRK